MEKKSIVQNVSGNGTYDGQYGTMYKYDITMLNGDFGEYSSKKYTSKDDEGFPFVVDKEVAYTFEDGKFPKIKPVYNQPNSFKGNKGSNASFALSYAKDTYVAEIRNGRSQSDSGDKLMFNLADKMLKWLNEN